MTPYYLYHSLKLNMSYKKDVSAIEESDIRYSSTLFYLLFLLACSGVFVQCSNKTELQEAELKFAKIEASDSGIAFANNLKPDVSTKFNLLDFDYFYNGAGVGVGDFNNDGFQDLFFAGNQVDNQLYLNTGNFEFEDITTSANINKGKFWSNGVCIVDINNDGWEDIYVSQGGPHEKGERRNLLYINQGDLTFVEEAELYGIDDAGISTQAAFFDYDKDGDLDCFVMNESLLYGHDPVTFHRLNLENPLFAYDSYSHLYRNEGGRFSDVTKSAGIVKPTFGLGLGIADLNADGWLDIYIANDYYQPDNLYINRKNGTFSDRIKNHLTQSSFFGMGMDIADVNNDGLEDIFVLDMASSDHVRSKTLMASMDTKNFKLLHEDFGFLHQYMFNSLQINNGNSRYSNVSQMTGLAQTDWSWACLLEDFDNDGHRDLFVTNGYRKYGIDNDFKNRIIEAKRKFKNKVPLEVKQDLYESMPSEPLKNVLFKNEGDLSFRRVEDEAGLNDLTYSNGAVAVDLDNDGFLDLVSNNIDGTASLYRNISTGNNYLNIALPDAGLHGTVELFVNGERRVQAVRRVRGYMSSMPLVASFGLGGNQQIDSVHVFLHDGRFTRIVNPEVNQKLILEEADFINKKKSRRNDSKSIFYPISPLALGIDFKHLEDDYNDFGKEVLLPYKQSTMGPCISTSDVNSDGVDDIFLGGAKGQAASFYISDQTNGYTKNSERTFTPHADLEDVESVFTDIDNDGDMDLLVLSGGNYSSRKEDYLHRIYIWNGSNFEFDASSGMDICSGIGGAIGVVDVDQDGDKDFIISNRILPQQYPDHGSTVLMINEKGKFTPSSEVDGIFEQQGIVNDILVEDLDNDGTEEIVFAQEWGGINILQWSSSGYKKIDDSNLSNLKGMFFKIKAVDANGDGLKDLVVGNIGENYKLKATLEDPLMIYSGDLDNNNTHDVVLSKKYHDEYVPVRGKECSSQQMPFIKEKFKTYESFAHASLVDIYGASNLKETTQKEITSTSSFILYNQGELAFEPSKLPVAFQSFPILDIITEDIDKNGTDDIMAFGNIYNTEVETPRLDGSSGIAACFDSKNGRIQSCPHMNLFVKGNVKQARIIDGPNGARILIVAKNDDVLSMFEIK